MKVCKFGGSSVASAEQIRKVKAIIEEDPDRRLVVVSAPGKRTKSDEKITDLLYTCHSLAEKGESIDVPFGTIASRYREIAGELNLKISLDPIIDEIREKIGSGASADYAASRGEYLSGLVIADFLNAEFIDAEKVIRLTDDGRVHESSYQLLAEQMQGEGLAVLPGFYGVTPDGEIKTFSRGGSDISGAIAARSVQAELYENWTDVSGILMADPRIAENPKPIRTITYREIREMASIGANVFHEEAIAPVKSVGIPIQVRNTNDPKAEGTLIASTRKSESTPVVGVSGKKPYRKLVVEKFMLNRYPQFPAQVEQKLREFNLVAEFELRGFDNLTLFVASGGAGEAVWKDVCSVISRELGADDCTVGKEVAMIGIVGEGLMHDPRIVGAALSSLEKAGIAVEGINYGGPSVTMLIAVAVEQYEQAIRVLTGTIGEL